MCTMRAILERKMLCNLIYIFILLAGTPYIDAGFLSNRDEFCAVNILRTVSWPKKDGEH